MQGYALFRRNRSVCAAGNSRTGETIFRWMYRSIKRKASEFDALLLPGGVIESRLSTYPTKGGRVRKVVLRCRKTGRLDLPRALDDHRDRRGTRTKGYLMAIAED